MRSIRSWPLHSDPLWPEIVIPVRVRSFGQIEPQGIIIIIIIIIIIWAFLTRTLLGILADLNNAADWMGSAHHLISKASSAFTRSLGIFPSAPITICITINFIFRSFFWLSSKVLVFTSLFRFLLIYSLVCRVDKVHHLVGSFFFKLSPHLIFWLKLGGLFVSQNYREFSLSHSPGRIQDSSFTYLLIRVFTSVLVDGLSQEFEWQQVFSNLLNSSQYSGRSQ